MGETKYDWTDKTSTGFAKEEFDALWTEVNGLGGAEAIDDLSDVTITGPANDEVLSYEGGTWINKTAAEAGLAGTGHNHAGVYAVIGHDHDSDYVELSGDSMTGPLTIRHLTNAYLELYDLTNVAYKTILAQENTVFVFKYNGTQYMRYRASDDAIELPIATTAPGGLLTGAVTFYEDTGDDLLWAQWKDSATVTHHAPIARAKRTIVSLAPGAATITGSASLIVIGANTDISAIRFPNGSTNTAAWAFARPHDWDYGTLRVTVWWTNYTNNVGGVHYWPQRLVGCATGEHLAAAQTCATLIAGAQSTAGLNNSSKIGVTIINGSPQTLTNEEFLNYRIQRQGGHGTDTSSANWEVIMVTVELVTT